MARFGMDPSESNETQPLLERDEREDGESRRFGFVRTFGVWGLTFAPVIVFLACALGRRWMDDDGFINLRIVRNVLEGHGPVYNVGERVEAFTSPLWIAFLVVFGALGFSLEKVAVFGGIACMAAGLVFAAFGSLRLDARSYDGRSLSWPLGLAVAAVLPPIWDYASSGLETGLAFLWLGGSYAVLLRSLDAPTSRTPLLAAFVFGLGPLIRPEFALYAFAMFSPLAYAVERDSKGDRPGLSSLARLVLAAATLPVLYQIFRMSYFAAMTANTAIAKEAFRFNFEQGRCYFRNFFDLYALSYPFGALSIFLIARLVRTKGDPARCLAVAAPVFAAVLHGCYVVAMGGDYMHGRMFLPVVFASILPVATVTFPSWRQADLRSKALYLVALPILVWLPICGTRLRVDRENVCGIGDERGWYARLAEVENPIALVDYRKHVFYGIAAGLRRSLAAMCAIDVDAFDSALGEGRCRKLYLDDSSHGRLVPAQTSYPLAPEMNAYISSAAVASAVGIGGYLLPSTVHLVDRLGLGDPVASRLVVGTRGRPGHEKQLSNAWIVARFAAPEDVEDASVIAARHALTCGRLADLQRATRAPLTPRLLLDNLWHASTYQKLRIPSDPFDAEERFCHGAPAPRSESAGGNGGRAFRWQCPKGTALFGISGTTTTTGYVSELHATCRSLDRDREVTFDGPSFGKASGESFAERCEAGAAVTRLRGRSLQVLRRFHLTCSDASAGETRAPSTEDETGTDFDIGCPEVARAMGIFGRSGDLVDAVGLVCTSAER